jgi:hypothetical protein
VASDICHSIDDTSVTRSRSGLTKPSVPGLAIRMQTSGVCRFRSGPVSKVRQRPEHSDVDKKILDCWIERFLVSGYRPIHPSERWSEGRSIGELWISTQHYDVFVSDGRRSVLPR